MPLQFTADAEMTRVILELAERRGIGIDDLMKRALATYKTIADAESEGLHGALIDSRGKVVARLTGI